MCKVCYHFSVQKAFEKELLEEEIKKMFQNVSIKNMADNEWVVAVIVKSDDYSDYDCERNTDLNVLGDIKKYCTLSSLVTISSEEYY